MTTTLYILRHSNSGMLWLGKTLGSTPKKIRHWKWKELTSQDSTVELLQFKSFDDPKDASDALKDFRKRYSVMTSAQWANSGCYVDKFTPYVYKIRHRETGIIYVGVRYGKSSNPSKFFKNYFTSSQRVKELGWENFDLEEIRVFKTPEAAVDHEAHILHKLYHELGRDRFQATLLNRSIAGTGVTDEVSIAKMLATREAKSPEEKAKINARISAAKQAKSYAEKEAINNKIRATRSLRPAEEKAIEYANRWVTRRLNFEAKPKEEQEAIRAERSVKARTRAPVSTETRAKQSLAQRNRQPHSKETIALRSASLRAFNASPEGLKSIARRAAKNTGKSRAPEVRAKMSISARNRSPVSEATRTLMRIAASSRPPQSAETIAKRVAKNTGKTRTAEQRANLRAGQQLRYT